MFIQQYVRYLADTLSKALDAHLFQNLWSRIWEMQKKTTNQGFDPLPYATVHCTRLYNIYGNPFDLPVTPQQFP